MMLKFRPDLPLPYLTAAGLQPYSIYASIEMCKRVDD